MRAERSVEVGVSAIIQPVMLVGVDKYSMQQLIGISLIPRP
jgi:hypothetical protein